MITKKLPVSVGIIAAAIMSSCDFNEDFCIRPGELIAYCDFSNIMENPPLPTQRKVIPFQNNAAVSEGTSFTQDTLRWSIPQGEYNFLFYTGEYKVENLDNYHECKLTVNTDTIDGLVYVSERQKYCCSAIFAEKLEYQKPKTVRIQPWNFVQKINFKLNITGNTSPVSDISYDLSGISTSKYLNSLECSGSAIVSEQFIRSNDTYNSSIYVFGCTSSETNILSVKVKMDEDNKVFNEVQHIDLSSVLKSFDGDEITLELDLHIGKELILKGINIKEWEDYPVTEL